MAKLNTKLVFLALVSALTVGISAVGLNPAYAEGEEESSSSSGSAQAAVHLQVSPPKTKISLEPGQTYHGTYQVQNVGGATFTAEVTATPYSVTDNYANPDYDNTATYSQMSEWITFDDATSASDDGSSSSSKATSVQYEIAPGQSKDVPYTIKVPKDVPAGGQYAALMAQTGSGNREGDTVQTISRVGMILYAEIKGGTTRREAEILSNDINGFYIEPPVIASGSVKNTGNVELTAQYTVKIFPFFGGESVYNNEEKPGTQDIYPETTRLSEIVWEGAPRLGVFWVEQTIDIPNVTSSYKKQLVIICPLWLIFIILAIIFFIIFMIVSNITKRKRSRGNLPSERDTKSFREKE